MNKKIGSIPQLYVRHCYALPSDYAYVAPLDIKKDKTMNDLQKMQTLAFWHGLLVATIENQIELHKEEPDIFEVPSSVTFDWALKLLDDHLDATDEMDSAWIDYIHEYGDIDDEVFKASYLYFLRLHTEEA